MVVFVCSQCNATLKKSNVRNHLQASKRCFSVSCVDCHRDFDKFSVGSHCVCISEKEKYDKANFLKSSKSNNDQKQSEWIKRVETAIRNCQSKRHKFLLQNLRGNCNVPQKKKKFENFMRSKYRGICAATIDEMWMLLEPLKQRTTNTVPPTLKRNSSNDLKSDEPKLKRQKVEGLHEPANNRSSENGCHLMSFEHIRNILTELGGKTTLSALGKKIYSTYKTSVPSPQEFMSKKEFKAKLLDAIQSSEYFVFSPSDGIVSMISDDSVTKSDPRVNPDISQVKNTDTSICQSDEPHCSKSIKRLLITTINDAGGRISLKKLVKRITYVECREIGIR
ncbi:unnamed protein product [Schistosoma turkestanicum]|nr:unnamed protein product [Schistosoma turkestanicum]